MQPNILTQTQKGFLPLIEQFYPRFYLVGGTALALQLGHRRSIDFDLFTDKAFDSLDIRNTIKKGKHLISRIWVETKTEFTLFVDNTKMTFYVYPYPIEQQIKFGEIISLPDVLTIGAMKAFALGKRAKWKDYVDLFFIFKTFDLNQVAKRASAIFGGEFDEKLFREQLAYYKDVDSSEEIEYMPGFAVDDNAVRNALTKISLT
jgi:hypothetical protein